MGRTGVNQEDGLPAKGGGIQYISQRMLRQTLPGDLPETAVSREDENRWDIGRGLEGFTAKGRLQGPARTCLEEIRYAETRRFPIQEQRGGANLRVQVDQHHRTPAALDQVEGQQARQGRFGRPAFERGNGEDVRRILHGSPQALVGWNAAALNQLLDGPFRGEWTTEGMGEINFPVLLKGGAPVTRSGREWCGDPVDSILALPRSSPGI